MTNPSTDISGLMAVLPRLLALPSATTTVEQRAAWLSHLQALPPLSVVASDQCFLPNSSAVCAATAWNASYWSAASAGKK